MLHHPKTIIAITKTKLFASTIRLGTEPVIDLHEEYDWNETTLPEVLQKIKNKWGVSVRILVSDEYVYLATFKIDKATVKSRESVRAAAAELIPEDLTKTTWDYRIYPEYVQVAVLNRGFYETLTTAAKKAGLYIEATESYSSALSRLLSAEKEPSILLYNNEISLAIALQNGVTLTTEVISELPTASHLKEIITFVQEQFGIGIKKIITTEPVSSEILTDEYCKTLAVETKKLDPAVGLAMKTDIKTPDADSLNLVIASGVVHPHTVPEAYMKYVLFVGAFLFTISSIFLGQKFLSKKKITLSEAASQSRTVSISPKQTPVASPSATISKSDYTIAVFNDSGVSGEAGRLSALLKQEDYTVIFSGNTQNANPGISIQYRSTVQKSYLNDLDKFLKTIYTTVSTEQKLASDEADITIIIGRFTKK